MKSSAKITILGNLKSNIIIVRDSNVSDGCGGYQSGSVSIRTCRASVKPLRAKEIVQASQTQQETSHNIIIRYFKGLKNSDKIQYKDKEFEIASIINIDNSNEFLELLCIERGN